MACGSSEGTIYLFNWDGFGAASDRFALRAETIDCMVPITDSIVCVGSLDGVIRSEGWGGNAEGWKDMGQEGLWGVRWDGEGGGIGKREEWPGDGMVWDGMGWDGKGWDEEGWNGNGMVWDGKGWDAISLAQDTGQEGRRRPRALQGP